MAGWQGLQEGGIPGAYFGVADYDANKKARQQQASMEMRQALADIGNTQAQTQQRLGAGRASDADAGTSWLEANRAEALQPGVLRAQGLGNTNQEIKNKTATKELSWMDEMNEANISLKGSQGSYQDALREEANARRNEMPVRLGIDQQKAERRHRARRRRVAECSGARGTTKETRGAESTRDRSDRVPPNSSKGRPRPAGGKRRKSSTQRPTTCKSRSTRRIGSLPWSSSCNNN